MKPSPRIPLWSVLLAIAALFAGIAAYQPPLEYETNSLMLAQTATIVYTASDTVTYVATAAEPGTSATAAKWQVKKIAQSGTTAPYATVVTWADGDNKFDNIPGASGSGLSALTYQ